jgi:hypothetical protein
MNRLRAERQAPKRKLAAYIWRFPSKNKTPGLNAVLGSNEPFGLRALIGEKLLHRSALKNGQLPSYLLERRDVGMDEPNGVRAKGVARKCRLLARRADEFPRAAIGVI